MAWTSVITQVTTGWASVANATQPSITTGIGGGEPLGMLAAITSPGPTVTYYSPWTSVITQVTN